MSKYIRKYMYVSESVENISLPHEEWRDIEGYEGYYKISNLGRILSVEREFFGKRNNKGRIPNKIKSQNIRDTGYHFVQLYRDNKNKVFSVHRLVAKAFIINDNPLIKDCVNHKDENKSNNNASNLEWCTREYNNNYGTRNSRLSIAHRGIKRPYHGLNSIRAGLKSTVRIGAYNDDGILVNAYKNRLDVREKFGSDVDYALYRKGKCKGFYWKRISEDKYRDFKSKSLAQINEDIKKTHS